MKRYQEETKTHIQFDDERDFNLFRQFMRKNGYLSNWTPSDNADFGADIDSLVFAHIEKDLKKNKIKYT
jgi:hypothetical protein